MNANELADELEAWRTQEKLGNILKQAATMLRQQQAEITQLKVAYSQEQYRSKQWQERFESGRLT